MKITEKLNMNGEEYIKNGPITIVAFGDSVTHGMLNGMDINYETVYHNRLRQKINKVKAFIPVNVINAGIGGITAKESLTRMEAQVFSHNPDLVIVCFGLNDVNGEIEDYLYALTEIFSRCKKDSIDVIFLTPNMLNTYVAEDTLSFFKEYAAKTAQMQNSGKMDMFMSEAIKLCENMNVTVCDCYSEWKKLAETTDTTQLLVNRMNHPTAEMHELFADKLFRTIFKDCPDILEKYDSQQNA